MLKVEGALGETKGRKVCLERRLQKRRKISCASIEAQQKQTDLLLVDKDMLEEVA